MKHTKELNVRNMPNSLGKVRSNGNIGRYQIKEEVHRYNPFA